MKKNILKTKLLASLIATSLIVPIFSENGNPIINESVEKNLIASTTLQSRLESEAIKKNEDILQIQVLDQRDTEFGEEACGYHSWKNALISLAVVASKTNSDVKFFRSLFNDKDFYDNDVLEFFYPKNSIPSGAKDLSIIEANKAYKKLITEKTSNENITKIASVLKKNPSSVSFLNPTNEMLFGGLEESSLSNIENFYHAATQPGAGIHAIVFGKFPHWTTLIMETDDFGTITWYGCDSYGNQTEELPENKEILEKYIKKIENLDEQVLTGYFEAVGFDLQNKSNWLKKGDLDSLLQSKIPTGIKKDAFNEDSLNINAIPKRIIAAFGFIKRMNLTKDDKFKPHLLNIKKLSDFYAENLKKTHPSLSQMKEISDFLKKNEEKN